MKAEMILLTHFSQRYPKIPNLEKTGHEKVGVAFDLMDIKWKNFPLLPKLMPVLSYLFGKEEQQKDRVKEENREKMAVTKNNKKKQIKDK